MGHGSKLNEEAWRRMKSLVVEKFDFIVAICGQFLQVHGQHRGHSFMKPMSYERRDVGCDLSFNEKSKQHIQRLIKLSSPICRFFGGRNKSNIYM